MNVAICFSGQPRFLEATIDGWRKNVIDHLNCDVFAHFWNEPPDEWLDDWAREKNITWKPNYTLIHALNPITLLMENQIDFRDKFAGIKAHASIQNTASMFYSLYQSNRLCLEHQWGCGKHYDIVIRARTDSLIETPLVIETLKENQIAIEHRGTSGDQFAYGSPDVMEAMANCYWDVDELLELHPLHPETHIRLQMQRNKIEIIPIEAPLLIRSE